jgi:surfeit locus 1 family protein
MPRGRDWVLVLVAVAAALVCVRLGVWQLSRLSARRAHNAEVRAARERAPLVVDSAVPVDSVAERRVVVQGVYDYDQERLWRGRLYQEVPGVHVLTPLRLSPQTAVLVDRGWVASPDAARIEPGEWRGPDSAVIEGIAVRMPRGRGDVDPGTIHDSLGYTLLPFAVQQVPQDRGPEAPREGEGGGGATARAARQPVPPPLPELNNGPHLGYAIQWFSFAIIVLIGTFALLRGPGRPQLPS